MAAPKKKKPAVKTLKVFRTAIGFHDAYVAVPSRKAALEAWGSDKNLFASGRAEEVTDAALTEQPLAEPGKVVKVARGSESEHLASLPKTDKPVRPKASPDPAPASKRPSRTALDRTERAVEVAKATRAEALDTLDDQIRALEKKRRQLAEQHDRNIERAIARRDEEADRFDTAIAEWRDA